MVRKNIRLYAGISENLELVDFGYSSGNTELMLKLTDKASSADNQQETSTKLRDPQRLYAEYPTRKKMFDQEATLLGILYTDGCLSKKTENCWRFYLSNTSFEIIQTFKECMIDLFGLDTRRVRISEKRVNGKPFYKAVVDSGYCGNYLTAKYGTFRTLAFKHEGKKIFPLAKLPFTKADNPDLVAKFLKAAFSCDGGINLYVGLVKPRNYRFLIRNTYLSCHHPQLQLDYQRLLSYLDIPSRILKADNKILVRGKNELRKFRDKVGFLEGVKITQHSAFWQGWEKNKVLDLAVDSYGKAETILNLPQFRIMR